MGLGMFGKKGGGLGGIQWGQLVAEAKVQNTLMENLHEVYQDNKSTGAHVVWKHLRDQSAGKMQDSDPSTNRAQHTAYVKRALKRAAHANENTVRSSQNYNKDNNLASCNNNDQVLLMFRAAQKNKTKATQMMGTKDKKGAVSYHPGLLTNKQETMYNNHNESLENIHGDDTMCNVNQNSASAKTGSSEAAYQKIKVEPMNNLPQTTRTGSRSNNAWQPLSIDALEEYSPQITVTQKPKEPKDRLWKVM